jgi:sporulation protein YlmC with PRC-barrel domain
MKLSKDAKIFTNSGQDIGFLSRFVLDPRTKRVTDIVFMRGLLKQTEHVIPMTFLDFVDEAGIHLKPLPVDKPEDLPPFRVEDFVVTDENALMEKGVVNDTMVHTYYAYPSTPFGPAGMVQPFDAYSNTPKEKAPSPSQMGIPVSGDSLVTGEIHENIPDNTVALKEGAQVISSDEKQLGSIEKLFIDPNSERITHLLIGKGLLLKEYKLIPTNWIDEINADNVYLAVDAALVNRVPDYKENR